MTYHVYASFDTFPLSIIAVSPSPKTLFPVNFSHSIHLPKMHRLLLLSAILISISSSQTLADDAAVMHELASLITSSSVNWSVTADPCTWSHIQCSSGRVTAIQIGNTGTTGTLPTSLNSLTALTRLEVMNNTFQGVIPSLSSLSSLQYLFLHDNNFSSIPENFFFGLNSLFYLTIGNNPLSPWSLKEDLKSCANIQTFRASNCGIMGKIPDFLGTSFPGLSHLELSYNTLEGGIPQSFASSSIKDLILNNQNGGKLTGGIDVITNMPSITQLWLHSNSFSGPLPDFTQLVNIQDLDLRDNQFTGPVPASLTNSNSIKKVVLTNNMLQGPMPIFRNSSLDLDLDPKSESFCRNDVGDCDRKVNILLSIAKSFGYPINFAKNWKGNDACNNWLGITCDMSGNIIVVNLKSLGLSGTISPDFGSLTSLQRLILSNNNLTGTIPNTLTSLKKLRELDVSNNNIYGKVPSFDKNVMVNTNGNPNIGKDGPGNSNGRKKSSFIVIILVCIVVVLVIGASVFCWCKKTKKVKKAEHWLNKIVIHPIYSSSKAKKDNFSTSSGTSSNLVLLGGAAKTCSTSNTPNDLSFCEPTNLVIPIEILRHVTNNFSENNILGRGGFGTVYKGELHDGTKIAVKRMEGGAIGSTGLTEFKSEISVLTRVRHRNLVALLGYCLDGNEKILVYEHMPQGTLTRYLFDWKKEGLQPLNWRSRLSIGLDVARGVEYLHRLAQQSFIHRDLKPSNILLGDDMRAKVSDFGLVKRAPEGQFSIETRLAGTFGYLAPEYAATGRVTTKADVYSFGVILMELITGRRALATDESDESMENIHLVSWFMRKFYSINQDLPSSIDPNLDFKEEESTLASINEVAKLACYCCKREPHSRPDMGHIVNVLSSQFEAWEPVEDMNGGENYGVDLDLTLPEVLKRWQESDSMSRISAVSQFSDIASGR